MVVGVYVLRQDRGGNPQKLAADLVARGMDSSELDTLLKVDQDVRERTHILEGNRAKRGALQKTMQQVYLLAKQMKKNQKVKDGDVSDDKIRVQPDKVTEIEAVKAESQALKEAIDIDAKVVEAKIELRNDLLRLIPNPQLVKRTFSTSEPEQNNNDNQQQQQGNSGENILAPNVSSSDIESNKVAAFVESHLDTSPKPKQSSLRKIQSGLAPRLSQACATRITNCLSRPLSAGGLGFCHVALADYQSPRVVIKVAKQRTEKTKQQSVCDSLASIHQGEWLLQADLPHRYVACSDVDNRIYLTSLDSAHSDSHIESEYDMSVRALYACVRELFPCSNVEIRVVQLESKQLAPRSALSHRIEARIVKNYSESKTSETAKDIPETVGSGDAAGNGSIWRVLAGVDHTTDFVSRDLSIRSGQKKILQVNGGLAYIIQAFVDVAAITTMLLLVNTNVEPAASDSDFVVRIPDVLQSALDGMQRVFLSKTGVIEHSCYAEIHISVPLPWSSVESVLIGKATGEAPMLLLEVGDIEARSRESVAHMLLCMDGQTECKVDVCSLCDSVCLTDLVELELALQLNSYVGGVKPSAGDATLLAVLHMMLADESREKFLYGVQYPNLTRWLRHIEVVNK